jgi:hypothetical protein
VKPLLKKKFRLQDGGEVYFKIKRGDQTPSETPEWKRNSKNEKSKNEKSKNEKSTETHLP